MKQSQITVYFKTYGCAINQSDSETMAGILESDKKNKFTITSAEKDAEVIIINSCTVKAATINNVLRYVNEKSKTHAIVMAGCLSQISPEKLDNKDIIGIKNLDKIANAVINAYKKKNSKIKNKEFVQELTHKDNEFKETRLTFPSKNKNDIIEILPISNGCLGECTYCAVRFARGNFFSYPKKDIKNRLSLALKNNRKEIWITSQDTGCYGTDKRTSITKLMSEILKDNNDNEYFIRLGMINPQHVIDKTDELAKILNHKNMFKFIHIPIQSGNNRVLELMKRKYTVDDFKKIINDLRKKVPDLTIATDIICGFPTETDKEFKDTIAIAKELEFDIINISKFGLHKKTKSANLKQVPDKIIKERSKILTEVFKEISLKKNLENVGKILTGIIDEEKKSNNTYVLRNNTYKPVILDKKSVSNRGYNLGDIVKVRINKANTFHLIGELV